MDKIKDLFKDWFLILYNKTHFYLEMGFLLPTNLHQKMLRWIFLDF
jgi:hypothetical protein